MYLTIKLENKVKKVSQFKIDYSSIVLIEPTQKGILILDDCDAAFILEGDIGNEEILDIIRVLDALIPNKVPITLSSTIDKDKRSLELS